MTDTHAIVDAKGNAVKTGTGEQLMPLLSKDFPYAQGYRVKPISEVNTTQDGNTVSAVTTARVEHQNASLGGLAVKLGLDTTTGFCNARPVVPLGTRVLPLGDDNFAESRAEHARRPLLEDALGQLDADVTAENRRDAVVRIKDLRMLATGELVRIVPDGTDQRIVQRMETTRKGTVEIATFGEEKIQVKGALAFEPQGLDQLLSFINGEHNELRRAGAYLRGSHPAIRAVDFNTVVSNLREPIKNEKDKGAVEGWEPVYEPRMVKLRTRNGSGPRRVYAAVSPSYGVFDADAIARAMGKAVAGMDLRGSVIYNPETTLLKINGGWHADKIVDLGAGDAFRCGMWFRSGDARNSGFKGGLYVERNACINFIILTYDQIETLNIKHVGADFADKAQAGIEKLTAQASELLSIFADDWGVIRKKPIADVIDVKAETYSDDPMTEAMAVAVKLSGLDKHVSRDVAVEMLLRGYEMEPGDNLDAIINAVTRVHDRVPVEVMPAYEEAAGKLMQIWS